ncbi:MAG TPA: methyltransferase domain-containing protein [Chitinophagaceae bacterium]|nr:methyltransferase domain-containing protein [Chitinophagaceae bacterium]
MAVNEYHDRISRYYQDSENAYKDAWDLDRSLSIHFGYWDEKVHSFPQSLLRMNEVMIEAAHIKSGERVLDAGCGVGGSSIFLAEKLNCRVTGITLSERQVGQARLNAKKKNLENILDFTIMDYSATDFPDASFDIVWGCESICYADNKKQFVKEAYRLLKPGGRLVVADGFISEPGNNQHPLIRQWLDGWQVNYLETAGAFGEYMREAGFSDSAYRDISQFTKHSSRRHHRFYYLASLYLAWKTISFSNHATAMQKKNIKACKYQYRAAKKGLWQYGLIVGKKQ